MKKVGFALALAVFLGLLSTYILYNYSPYNPDKLKAFFGDSQTIDMHFYTDNINEIIDFGLLIPVLDEKIIGITTISIFAGVVALISGLHMLVDKLFYKRFFEEPLLWPALRRGILIALYLAGLFFFRLIGGLNLNNFALLTILVIILEIALNKFTDKPR